MPHDLSPGRSSRSTVAELGTILSIWAHPDDETYLAGGVMARARDLGQRVVCVTASAGERGTADPATWPPERLGRLRRWEATAAMSVLGVTEHHVLGLPDGELRDHGDAGRSHIRSILDDVAPDTVVTFGPDGMTFHPDHIAVHEWVVAEVAERRRRPRMLHAVPTVGHMRRFGPRYEDWNAYMTDERPRGVEVHELALHLELTACELDRKVAALRSMASQTSDLVGGLGLDEYAALVAEEAFVASA